MWARQGAGEDGHESQVSVLLLKSKGGKTARTLIHKRLTSGHMLW
jgi:hypothetical protein